MSTITTPTIEVTETLEEVTPRPRSNRVLVLAFGIALAFGAFVGVIGATHGGTVNLHGHVAPHVRTNNILRSWNEAAQVWTVKG